MVAAAFWSYVHSDNDHESGRIARLHERLERSIRFYSGIREFRIFLDKKAIGWGENWATRIATSLDDALLLFPIVTPTYFSSPACREELLAFHSRQQRSGRDDLILPLYYLSTEAMDGSDDYLNGAAEIEAASILRSAQYEDWRALRQTEETDPSYAKAIERLAQQATKAIKRGGSPEAVLRVPDQSGQLPSRAKSDPPVAADGTAEAARPLSAAAPGHIVTLTVSQMPNRAQFASITEAISRAPGGARILVAPGHYRESLTIDKPLELVGDGSRDDIVLEVTDGSVLVFDANIGTVRNFTLRQSQNDKQNYCVSIKQGRLELEDCDISSSSGACIAVTNNADPRLRRNVIHHGKRSGILILDAHGSFEDNQIFGMALAALQVTGNSNPTVRRNRIFDSQLSGVLITRAGRGIFEDNEIFGNATGINVKEGSIPLIRRNRIYDNRGTGIVLHEESRGTIEDNEIFGNRRDGIAVSDKADPSVRRNQIHNNNEDGLYVHDEGRGMFENNELRGNMYAGITVVSKGNPTVRNNCITENSYEAIWIKADGLGTYLDNDLRNNKRGPWDIDAKALPKINRKNNIDT